MSSAAARCWRSSTRGFRPPVDRNPVSLGSRLRGEGQLGYDQLERFGNDLFAALDALAAGRAPPRHQTGQPRAVPAQ
ncbi:hypothetical protein NKH18_21605 [Streptomyces sp. M10(2022)]